MLRESLHNPGLAPEQRAYIKDQLALAGTPKVYGPRSSSADSAQPTEGTEPVSSPTQPVTEPASPSEPLPDEAALNRMTKAEIAAQAEREGIEDVSTSQLKAEMIETLLAGRV